MKRKTTKKDLQDMVDNAAPAGYQAWQTGPVAVEGAQELTTPPIIKIGDMPVGAFVDCTILDVIPSRQQSIRNPLIIIQTTQDGNKHSLPSVAALGNVLLPDYDEKEDRDNPVAKCPFVGKRVIIKKTGIKESKTFKEDDQKTPRKFPVFDVFVYDADAAAAGTKKGGRRKRS